MHWPTILLVLVVLGFLLVVGFSKWLSDRRKFQGQTKIEKLEQEVEILYQQRLNTKSEFLSKMNEMEEKDLESLQRNVCDAIDRTIDKFLSAKFGPEYKDFQDVEDSKDLSSKVEELTEANRSLAQQVGEMKKHFRELESIGSLDETKRSSVKDADDSGRKKMNSWSPEIIVHGMIQNIRDKQDEIVKKRIRNKQLEGLNRCLRQQEVQKEEKIDSMELNLDKSQEASNAYLKDNLRELTDCSIALKENIDIQEEKIECANKEIRRKDGAISEMTFELRAERKARELAESRMNVALTCVSRSVTSVLDTYERLIATIQSLHADITVPSLGEARNVIGNCVDALQSHMGRMKEASDRCKGCKDETDSGLRDQREFHPLFPERDVFLEHAKIRDDVDGIERKVCIPCGPQRDIDRS